jgi:tryptophan-rich sensory protein
MRPRDLSFGSRLGLVALAVLPIVAASLIGNAATMPKIAGWYASLVKPAFNPPNWLFGPVWTLLFAMMAYSVYRIWTLRSDTPGRNSALVVFYAQLLLNPAWSIAFFGMENPGLGLAVIVPFLALIVLTIVAFRPLDRMAAMLLVPYAVWVSYATVLNISLWWLNR